MKTKISNGTIITGGKEIKDKSLYFENGKITAITDQNLPCDKEIDAKGNYISPGFIDIHVHGGGGHYFYGGGTDCIIKAAEYHLKFGTTSIYPTCSSATYDFTKNFVLDVKKAMESNTCKANIMGAHIEGPYFSFAQCGAQKPEFITAPIKEEYEELIKIGEGTIKRWSFAPEHEGSVEFCQTLLDNDIVPSIGHSDAQLKHIEKVYDIGCKSVTHLYSGMSTISRERGVRKLGVIESTFLLDDMNAELIADGMHVPPELLKVLFKCKPTDKIMLITDALKYAGLSDEELKNDKSLEKDNYVIEEGVVKFTDGSSFAGSIATTNRLVRTIVQHTDNDLATAVKMASENPAKHMGLDTKGSLEIGYDADILIFDKDINILNVFVGGNEVK